MQKRKIRVLHIYKVMNRGGAETFLMNVYRNIDKEKFQFEFLCFSNKKGDYDKEISSLGGIIHYLDSKMSKNPVKNMIQIIKKLKQIGIYDVIHIPMMFYSGVLAFYAKIVGIKKVIVHAHSASDKVENKLTRKIYRNVMRLLINIFADNKLACGKKAAKFLYGNNKNVKIINNGIDIDSFQNIDSQKTRELKAEFEINDQIVVGNIARFAPVKNHEYFIKLAEYCKEKQINMKFILIGDGELKDKINSIIEEKKLSKFFCLPGLREDIARILTTIDVICMPSLYEGFPVSIVESLASGTPCVLSNRISKEVELIKNMVEFIDIEESVEKTINTIMELSKKEYNTEEIKEILERNNFSIKSITNELEKLYRNYEK